MPLRLYLPGGIDWKHNSGICLSTDRGETKMLERKPIKEISRRCPRGRGGNAKVFGLSAMAGLMAQLGMAQAASADGPAVVPSALHALAMLAAFCVLASLRVTRTGGRLRIGFELSPIPRTSSAKQKA
jgi:hypothetical protein